ncbi:MAG: murein L,D-transpeptidase catalytic domain family protein [Bacteroidetes bacterium]|nr:murein L,D-transpeptidase catalytic domain family protein [Bacteroidota bacterium]
MNLSKNGLASEVFQLAIKGHLKLETDCKLRNSDILTIVDFSQSSKNKRLYVIDIKHKTLLFNTYVAHGRNTGDEYARHFSNVSGSFQSSLGFYVTKEQIFGYNVGLSLILDGMEKGFNDNALKREIIIHGADYATENFIRKTGRLGRSYGCPSLPPELVKPVVETIKEGTCLFIYYQDAFYLSHSTLLN